MDSKATLPLREKINLDVYSRETIWIELYSSIHNKYLGGVSVGSLRVGIALHQTGVRAAMIWAESVNQAAIDRLQ